MSWRREGAGRRSEIRIMKRGITSVIHHKRGVTAYTAINQRSSSSLAPSSPSSSSSAAAAWCSGLRLWSCEWTGGRVQWNTRSSPPAASGGAHREKSSQTWSSSSSEQTHTHTDPCFLHTHTFTHLIWTEERRQHRGVWNQKVQTGWMLHSCFSCCCCTDICLK